MKHRKNKDSKNLLSSGTMDPEEIRRIAPKIAIENATRLKILSILSVFIWCVMLICAIFVDYMWSNSPYYIIALIGSAFSVIMAKYALLSKRLLQLGIAIFAATLLSFGMAVGLQPNGNATAYIALLFCIPQLFCFRPKRIIEIIFLPNLIFIPLCIHYKSGIQLEDDIINILSFGFVALIISLMTSRSKVNEIILKEKLNDAKKAEERRRKRLEQLVYDDELTGLHNFHAYKTTCETISDQRKDIPIGILYADMNRLKYINDTMGHDAGDKYICDFANSLRKTFPDDYCFRISGDEFKVICFDGNLEKFVERVNDFEQQIKSQSIPCASIGYVADITSRIEELSTVAEIRMYEDKRAFYARFPEFVR